jgi:hypothetical protein
MVQAGHHGAIGFDGVDRNLATRPQNADDLHLHFMVIAEEDRT